MKNPISKQQIKAIKGGDTSSLFQAIETLIYLHKEDNFTEGYKSCLADMRIRSERLAEYIGEQSEKLGMRFSLSKTIENYFNEALDND